MKTTEKMDPLSLQCWLLAFQMLSFEGEIIHPKSTKRLTGWVYLPLCVCIWNEMTKLWTWPLTQQKHIYSTAPGIYLNSDLNLTSVEGQRRVWAISCSCSCNPPGTNLQCRNSGHVEKSFCQMSCNLNVKLKNEMHFLCSVWFLLTRLYCASAFK